MQFTLNGETARHPAPPEGVLLYLLRQHAGTTSVRFGCGAGQCGACMVVIDGVAEPSCQVANAQVEGRQVQTAEGLARDGVGAIVLQAFIDEQAAQCGYCLSGILMSVTALLTRTPAPSAAALAACLDRHLCRCGTHLRIQRAVQRAIAALASA